MRFLLVVPLAADGSDLSLVTRSSPRVSLDGRLTSNARLLVQDWTTITPKGEASDVVKRAAQCIVGGTTTFAIEAEYESSQVGELSIAELENALSRIAIDFVAKHSDFERSEVPWVARYVLLGEYEKPPSNWLDASLPAEDISSVADVPQGQVLLRLGWGNGAVERWDLLQESVRDEIVRGIIDAQFIWHDFSRISDDVEDCFDEIVSAQARVRRTTVRALMRELTSIQIAASSHQRLYDELLLGIQGVRRESGMALLRSWRYERVVERLTQRVSDLATQVENLQSRVSSRHQSAVQTTLWVLGLLVIIDTSLALIATAYTGEVRGAPGADGGVFSLIRAANADLVLGVALVCTAVLAIALGMRRR